MNKQKLEQILEKKFMWFLENRYQEFKQDYECSYPEGLNQIIMWGEYIRCCSNFDFEDLFWDETSGEGLSDDDIKAVKNIVREQVETMLNLYDPIIFPGLYANNRRNTLCQ